MLLNKPYLTLFCVCLNTAGHTFTKSQGQPVGAFRAMTAIFGSFRLEEGLGKVLYACILVTSQLYAGSRAQPVTEL